MDWLELEAWQRELLESARVARLGTVGGGGQPHLVVVCFALAGDEIVIAIDEKPKRGGTLTRVRNIQRDERVSLLVDHYEEDWSRLAWVRVDGHARVVERGEERPDGLAALREKYEQYRAMGLESRQVIVIAPGRVIGWRATGDDFGGGR